jgi:hypothetical protein
MEMQMADSYDLTKLNPDSFEHLVNGLAFRVLGPGLTVFGAGSDGGRDGYFEGEAPYPSQADRWSGRWYIQSKFHKPHLSADPQAWLLAQIKSELGEFQRHDSRRLWPDNWIVATNIDPSGKPQTGCFDRALALVQAAKPELTNRFHIWGGQKILQLLIEFPGIAAHYAHFLTPGNVISKLFENLSDSHAQLNDIFRSLIVSQFNEQQFTKLEQAGSAADNRPGIHRLFTDLPFKSQEHRLTGRAAQYLARAAAQTHRLDPGVPNTENWRSWQRYPSRARVWFIKGGPGQGKSTLGQYLCQIQRAALILGPEAPVTPALHRQTAKEIEEVANNQGLWPLVPRIPVSIELKDFAQWYGSRNENESKGILTYLAQRITANVEQLTNPGTLKRAFESARWLFVFDGLDEVPGDVKDAVAGQIIKFNDEILIGGSSDALIICTSRPQGYAGQFANLDAAIIELPLLSPEEAIACARPVLEFNRTAEEFQSSYKTLREAILSPSVREIMTTPLQAHIMAVVMRDGGKPPDRRWQLFSNFYQTIKKREANRNLPDRRLAALLREGDRLLKALHNRIGFELHYRAERSKGAQTSLDRSELRSVVEETVSQLQDTDIDSTVATVMEATTDRLMLVSTPESSTAIRFDIRPLQEFFAAEYIYESTDATKLGERLQVIAADPHWREVMHFLLSALVENGRQTELVVAISVLAMINDGNDEASDRQLFRRLALGSLSAARLLSEGVLDQDKRVRNQFRALLGPILGVTDTRILSILIGVRRTQTRNWLCEECLNSLKILTERENIGGVLVLCKSLPEEHPKKNEVIQYISNTPQEYRACLFQLLNTVGSHQEDRANEPKFPEWVIGLVLKSLLDPEWYKLGRNGVTAAIAILHSRRRLVPSIATAFGLSPTLAKLTESLLCGPVESHLVKQRPAEFGENIAVLKIEYYKIPEELNYNNWSEEIWVSLANAPGILNSIYKLSLFAKSRSRDQLAELLHCVEANVSVLSALPEHLHTYLPYNQWRKPDLRAIDPKDLDDTSILTVLDRKKAGFIQILSLNSSEEIPDDQWDTLFSTFPELSIWLFSQPRQFFGPNKTGNFETPGVVTFLALALLREPTALLRYPAFWGKLLGAVPPMEEKIRAAISSVAKLPVHSDDATIGLITPFVVRLPEECDLLPHLVNTITEFVALGYDDRRRFLLSHSQSSVSIGDMIIGFIPSPIPLFKVLIDDAIGDLVRAAASMMYLLHPHRDLSQQNVCGANIVAFYRPEFGPRYLRAAAMSLHNGVFDGNAGALASMSELLRMSGGDYESRLLLDPVLESWRQRSKAPVHSHQSSDLWI